MSIKHLNALPAGFEFDGYRIERVLGTGGFGITYLATETAIDRQVAIKEYLPAGVAGRRPEDHEIVPVSESDKDDYAWGLDRFQKEAATLVTFRHPNIVPVLRFFNAFGTAYLVMEYQVGESLETILLRDGTLSEAKILSILEPLLDGLEQIHAKGFLHRDIKPDNIYMRDDGSPVLIDFGAARETLNKSKGLTAIITEGYAPVEQYETDGNQGPWTDIYALGASIYRCMTGERPSEAPKRAAALARGEPDPLTPIGALTGKGEYSRELIVSVEYALRALERDRPAAIANWKAVLAGATPPAALVPAVGAVAAKPAYQSPAGDVGDGTMLAGRPVTAVAIEEQSWRRKPVVVGAMAAVVAVVAIGAVLALTGGDAKQTGPITVVTPPDKNGSGTPVDERAALEKAVTDARKAHLEAPDEETKVAAFEKVIEAETALARYFYTRFSTEGKAATKEASSLYDQKKYDEAVIKAKEGARYGDPNAMNLLGLMAADGNGLDQDAGLSAYWYRRAAELGDEFAQMNLAYYYYNGKGVPKDPALAFKWAERAAAKQQTDALYLKGVLHETGKGTQKSRVAAREAYVKAADKGHVRSMTAAGRLLLTAKRGTKDRERAVAYLRQAAAKGSRDAERLLGTIPD